MVFNSTDLIISQTQYIVHKDMKLILRKTKEISKKLGIIYDDNKYLDYTTMSVYCFPVGLTKKVVDICVLNNLLFYIDDLFSADARVTDDIPSIDDLVNAWNKHEFNTSYKNEQINTTLRVIGHMSNTIQKNSNPKFFQRLSANLYLHLVEALNPTPYKTIKEYTDARMYFSGMVPTLNFIEYVNNVYITPDFRKQFPAISIAERIAIDIGGLANDIISYPKEKHTEFNLINAYIKTNEANNFDEAIRKSIDLVNKIYDEFKNVITTSFKQIEDLNLQDKNTITLYLHGLEHIVAATYHWQLYTHRYNHPEHFLADMKT